MGIPNLHHPSVRGAPAGVNGDGMGAGERQEAPQMRSGVRTG